MSNLIPTVLIGLLGGTVGGIGFFVGGHLADAWGRRKTTVPLVASVRSIARRVGSASA